MADVTYRFLAWARSGLAAGVSARDTLGAGTPGRARLDVGVTIGRRAGAALEVTRPLALAGPGEALGLDPRQVIRTDPKPDATDFEPNFLALLELDRPDLPWLFTPAAATTQHRLRPWLALVVVARGDGVSLDADPSRPLPALTVAARAQPSRQLPDLAESWAWAHAQVVAGPGDDVDALLADRPDRTASRLLCPRRLDPDTAYLACVVPTFEAGRRAGLGLAPEAADEAELRPAWRVDADVDVVLPVLYSWRFATGRGGDFESLARALRPRPLPLEVGRHNVYVGAAGAGLPRLAPDAPGAIVALQGALRPPGASAPALPDATRAATEAALRDAVDAPERRLEGAPGAGPAVAPPIYGRWLASQRTVPADQPRWLRTLNLDPRNRAIAGLATRIAQIEEERLMEQAWAQVGRVDAANRELRLAQLARELRGSLVRRHVAPLPAGALLQVTSPAHRRLLLGPVTARARIAASALPDAAVSPAFRRALSPRGAVARRAYAPAQRVARGLVEGVDAGRLAPEPPDRPPDGLFSLARSEPARAGVSADVRARLADAARVAAAAPPRVMRAADVRAVELSQDVLSKVGGRLDDVLARPGFPRVGGAAPRPGLTAAPRPDAGEAPRPGAAAPLRQRVQLFRDAIAAAAERAAEVADRPPDPQPPPLGVAALRPGLLARLDPALTMQARTLARVRIPPTLRPRPARDPLEEILAAPTFPQPAWELVRDHFPEHMLPGLEHVPADTATLVETNPPFVEAMLVGLNHEIARELLWREYPTDQRGSPFRRFWVPGGADDVAPVHAWSPAADLGGNLSGGEAKLVLLVRGELLRRYPSTVVYAVPDANGRPRLEDAVVRAPLFRGALPPDVTFAGFDLTLAQARAGFWLVFEEQPTEPRFGLDVAQGFGADAPALAQWNDLSWSHLAAGEAALADLTHIGLASFSGPGPAGPRWGDTSATMAAILAQQPVRVCMRAADLLRDL